jgi:hypothetical protein
MSEKPKISKETCINYREKLDVVFKNQVYNMARGEKLKGQLNENFSSGQLYMCKRVSDNKRRKYKRARGQNLKGGYNENLVSGSFPGRKFLTWTRVALVSKNGAHQFQIKGKRNRFNKVPVVGILLVCGEYLSQDPKKGEKLTSMMAGFTMHDDD